MGKLIDERLTTAESAISTLNSDKATKFTTRLLHTGENLNNYTAANLLMKIDTSSIVTNAPTSGISIFNIALGWGILQVAIHYSAPIIYARILFATTWSSWYRINTTILN